ncbi:hypothetical protein D5086_032920 [Populus alba]|uniref:Uncharacterized protein n=1 Tax=Populus alba TaxID=43335 RepID=A0ACC4AFC2_POPAL
MVWLCFPYNTNVTAAELIERPELSSLVGIFGRKPIGVEWPKATSPAHPLRTGEMLNVGLVTVSPDSHLLRPTLLEWTEGTQGH